MADMTLVTANKNYCLWPLPAWLCLKIAELKFDEITIPFGDPNARQLFEKHSPSGSVPALKHGELTLWESLAICEYVAELAPEAGLWPEDPNTRALARAVASEMYSGYKSVVSRTMPTNVRRRTGPLDVPEELQKIIDRNTQIWRKCRAEYASDGPYLFGRFSIADAFSCAARQSLRGHTMFPSVPLRANIATPCGAIPRLWSSWPLPRRSPGTMNPRIGRLRPNGMTP